MDNKIDITVIIPVYNAALLINRCLDAVFAQTKLYQLEVIIVDDGSTDNSLEIIKGRKEKSIILLQQQNTGPASARNKGIAIAKGEFITFIDADDYWLPEFIEKTISVLKNNTSLVAVSVMQKHIIKGKGVIIVPQYYTNLSQAIILDDFFNFWADQNHICTGSVMMRTETVKKTNGQRTELRITEDLEFWGYLATFGKWAFLPEVLFVSDGTAVTNKIGWLNKNKLRWASAPTVETWERRIINNISKPLSQGYLHARGRIAKNLCYSMILSQRTQIAYKEIKKYEKDFPHDIISRVLRIGVKNRFFWRIVSSLLIYREFHKK